MGLRVERTVRRVEREGPPGPSQTLHTYRETPAWVLLGDPGAGKTTEFEEEAKRSAGTALCLPARDFLTLDPANRPEWRERTLLIDGLDEVRAGKQDARMPFDAIRRRLDALGRPPFRLSCREADWLGDNDRRHLEAVSPDGKLVLLRLDSLTDDDARRLISSHLGISAAPAFFAAASGHGLETLLGNPQTLELLVRVFRDSGRLPASRLDTFEEASALLACEPNEEHRIGGEGVPAKSVLKAAGWLSAVQLLSRSAGHCLTDEEAGDGYLPISLNDQIPRGDLRAALRTRLFAADGEKRFRPAHAHLAAFLAARHLARLAKGSVPGSRILTLLAGRDGTPPTPLRGLAAWLAATSPELRRRLIERDPVAVLLYGDIRGFAPNEKNALLDEIGRDPSRLHESFWPASAVEGLAGEAMSKELVERLNNGDRSRAQQAVVEVLVEALSSTTPGTGPSEALLSIVRDPTYWPRVRQPALDAWVRSLGDRPERITRMRAVLDEFHDDPDNDPDRDILGTLLPFLYPSQIAPSEVWKYFRPPARFIIGRFFRFWSRLPQTCPAEHLPTHLDHLAASGGLHRDDPERLPPAHLPASLLARALGTSGAAPDGPRLARWLRLGLTERGRLSVHRSEHATAVREVREWLGKHPETQKAVIRAALRTDEFRNRHPEHLAPFLGQLLYLSPLPADIGNWHLDEAMTAESPRLVESHLTLFLRTLADRPVGVDRALAEARRRVDARPEAIRFLDDHLESPLPEWRIQQANERRHFETKSLQPDTVLLEAVRNGETELRENRASGRLLHEIALRYLGRDSISMTGSRERLVLALGGDRALVEAALTGVFGVLGHDDLPSAEEILKPQRAKRMSVFVVPVLTAVHAMNTDALAALTPSQVRTALACRLCFYGFSQTADWYSECVRSRPDLVAGVLVLFGRRLLRTRKESFPDFYSLAHTKGFDTVARMATEPLLRAFPVLAATQQLDNLNQLLWSGLQHLEPTVFRALVEKKAAAKSMPPTQRVRWLAAGLASGATGFLPRLAREVGGSERRVHSLVSFFDPSDRVPRLTEKLETPAIEFVIRTLGKTFEPLREAGWQTIRMKASDRIERFIADLAERGDERASNALHELASDPGLSKWRSHLEHATDTQRVVRRDAAYEPPTPEGVIAALRDGPPAGAGDLRELVVDRLERLAEVVRATNDNFWRQFWNEDPKTRKKTPKHEDACRDAILGRLSHLLPRGCDAQPEGHYAGNRRADLRVTGDRWNVPVEVKKNAHAELWRAVRNQLIPRYTNDPATEGLGIYLVLWFGPERTVTAPTGRPATPEALRERLLEEMTDDERRRAAIVVMDVTPP